MSALFGPRNFEERLQLAFRGSAKEQKKAKKDLFKERKKGGLFSGAPQGSTLGSNVFANKQNLGGTQR